MQSLSLSLFLQTSLGEGRDAVICFPKRGKNGRGSAAL